MEFAGDLSKPDFADQAFHDFPDVQILVNNLGNYEPKPFEEISDQDWAAIIETNFMSGARLSRHYLPKMKAKNWGRIIFVSSESAINIPVEMGSITASRRPCNSHCRAVVAELTPGTGVTVNSVLPGPTWSRGVV